MRRWLGFFVVVAACGDVDSPAGLQWDPPEPGTPTPSCMECGSGAILQGRVIAEGFVVGPSGEVVSFLGDTLSWLTADLDVEASATVAGGITDVALDATGAGVAITAMTRPGEPQGPPILSLVGFDRTVGQTWFESPIALNTSASAVSGDRAYVAAWDGSQVQVVDVIGRASGDPVTTVTVPDRAFLCAHLRILDLTLAPLPGGALIAGSFDGTLALGGTAPTLTSMGCGSGLLAAVDANGVGQWAIAIDVPGNGFDTGAAVISVATDAVGNVAFVASWTGPSATVGGTTVPQAGSSNLLVGMLDPVGTLRWSFNLGGGDHYYGLGVATDGTTAFVAGWYALEAFELDPDAQAPVDETDAFVLALTGAGTSWVRLARGPGRQYARIVGLRSTGLLAVLTNEWTFGSIPSMAYGDVTLDGRDSLVELAR